jgi:molybdopterin/thiamine biosynthesis adenylyltransferase
MCRRSGLPEVVSAMDGVQLQLLTCRPDGPCWRCVFPRPDPDWRPLGFRVLGAVAGTAGCLAAAEAVKLLVGAGSVLDGRLLFADLWEMSFRTVAVRRLPGCPDCASMEGREEPIGGRTEAIGGSAGATGRVRPSQAPVRW